MSLDTSRLHDRLDELVEDVPLHVRVHPERAWRTGRARRVRNRAAVGAVAVGVVAAVVGWTVLAPPNDPSPEPAEEPGGGVHQYSQRLDHAYWSGGLPDVTGPLAGLVQRNGDSASGWYAVSPTGHLWEIDDATSDATPALSPDGTHLGYLRGSELDAEYVVVDQRDGTTTDFPDIGSGAFNGRTEKFDTDHRYFTSGQAPAYWSPDGTGLLIRAGTNDPDDPDSDVAAVVLRTDGTVTQVTAPPAAGSGVAPVGWVSANRVALVEWGTEQSPSRVWLIDVETGNVLDSFPLEDEGRAAEAYQWFGTVSPVGSKLATSTTLDGEQVRWHPMRGALRGTLLARLPGIPSPASSCAASWSSEELFVPSQSSVEGGSAVLVRANGGTAVLADPRLDVVCSTWARDALDGTPYESWGSRIFGQQTGWLAWHWREVALGVAGGLVVVAAFVLALVRRRRRRQPRTGS